MKNCFASVFGAPFVFICGLICAVLPTKVEGTTTTFTNDTVITPVIANYDGQDIVIRGCTLTVNGAHSFNSLLLTNKAVLTHSQGTNGEIANQLNLTVAQGVIVDVTSRIDASAKGFSAANGPGAGISSDLYGGSGGGHGGEGGIGTAAVRGGVAYDTIMQPAQPGSGGGNGYFSTGGKGGGVIRLTVGGTLVLEGVLVADGGVGDGAGFAGAGSGGSIILSIGAVSGYGSITANGGSAINGGAGGGGRILVSGPSGFFIRSISAFGGTGQLGQQIGGAGTIFIKAGSQSTGELRVDNNGNAGQMTPLDSLSPYNLTIANQAMVYPSTPLTIANLTMKTNGILTCLTSQTGLNLTILTNLVIEAGGWIGVDGKGFGAINGPGAGGSSKFVGGSGGGHGGNGGSSELLGGVANDSILAPVQFGSGGGNGYVSSGGNGGGAIGLSVGGILQVEGALTADGDDGSGYIYGGGGAGGSLYLTVGTLTGKGLISANGGASLGGGGGGGGRVAVYFDTNNFTGSLLTYGGLGAIPGGAGTIYKKSTTSARGQTLIHNGGNPGGLTRLHNTFWPPDVYFDLTVGGAAQVIPDMPLTFGNLLVTSGATVSQDPSLTTLQLVTIGDARIDPTASINADGLGFGSGKGPGSGGNSAIWGGGGGGYGGRGGAGTNGAAGGPVYGSAIQPLDLGSGGGSGYQSSGGAGGGVIRLSVGGILEVRGTLTANGGQSVDYIEGGGGSGGSVFLTSGILTGSGVISANGGTSIWGGGGGGGRIAMYGNVLVDLPTPPVAKGGIVGNGSNTNRNGQAGTVYSSTNVPPFQVVSVTPSGVVTHPLSSVDIFFNAGVSSNFMASTAVTILTPGGQLPQNQITVTPSGGPIFTVQFPLQTNLGQYTIKVGPHVKDLYGRELDQNGNGVAGETPGDVYSSTFNLGVLATISGSVRLTNGTPVANVLLNAGQGITALTDTNGNYTLYLSKGWTGTVTPSKTACLLTPSTRNYTNVSADLTGQDYTLQIGFVPMVASVFQDGTLNLEWNSILGIQYQLQTSVDLKSWSNAGRPIPGTGGLISWPFDTTSQPRLFIRIVANN